MNVSKNAKNRSCNKFNNKQITKLPDNLTIERWLDLRGTQITELPDNLTVGGWLDLENTQITKLPDNLKVRGNIYKDF